MLPEPEEFGKRFHELFKQPSENQRKRIEWKKLKKRNTKSKDKRKNKLELINDNGLLSPPEIELPGNASAFAVFASVRLAVLERWMRHATQEYLQSSCSAPLHDISEIDSDTEENSQNSTYLPLRVSKIVGLGLRSVFELIKESRTTHPALCTKALLALLDVLQGQTPEGLRGEPPDVMEPLFELLLDLATLHGPEPAAAACNDGSHLTAVACACLLALVVVRGDTGRYLAAVAALLMAPRALAVQRVPLPAALTALQRSVHGVLLGRATRPDFTTHGVSTTARIDHFSASMPADIHNAILTPKALTSDGHFLYLFTNRGLFKIGTGYGGTIKGHVYIWKPEFYPNDRGWIGFCNNNLYLKLGLRRGTEILTVERQGLHIVGTVSLDPRDFNACVIFSDGDNLGTITPAKDDGFIVRTLNPNVNPASCINELPLKLARKCIDVLGTAAFEEEPTSGASAGTGLAIGVSSDEEVACIVAGKEFALLRTGLGRVLWCGRAAALGLKAGSSGTTGRTGRWTELPLTKAPRITHIAVGHEGLHGVLVAEDGAVFFCGTARRGEDGDHSKARRQPKPAKPKKMIKVDGVCVIHATANHGSTALVTRDGELLMFGKDTAHADASTGVVTALKGEHVTLAALGKAHAVVLTAKGHVYTFGINNKYQCGREPAPIEPRRDTGHVAMDTCGASDELDAEEPDPIDVDQDEEDEPGAAAAQTERHLMCAAGRHAWRHDLCMVCTVCRECTGYSISCLSSMRPDRNPGQECGCGEGDSGCAVCGCCRICARDSIDNSELAILGPSGAGDLAGMMRLDLIFRVILKAHGFTVKEGAGRRLQEQLARRLDDRRVRQRKVGTSSTVSTKYKSLNPPKPLSKVKEHTGSDAEKDAARVVCFPPARLMLPSDSPVIQVACGLHHTVLLTVRGEVFTFGSNQYGQLGCGDILAQAGITQVKLPSAATHIGAGSNHTVVLTVRGEVYTFGNNNKGQLGREPPGLGTSNEICTSTAATATTSRTHNPRSPWYSAPGPIPGMGPRHGRRATWVGAAADQTFLKIDESLINSVSLARSTVIANKSSIVLLPNQMDHVNAFKCLVINKHDGSCNSFSENEQVNFCNQAACVDPLYNVLWSYNPINHDVTCYNIVASEIQNACSIVTADKKILTDIKTLPEDKCPAVSPLINGFNLQSILNCELALPVVTNCFVTRLQAAVHLLGCLDTLAAAHELRLAAVREETTEPPPPGKAFSRDDFTPVNRFESHGGGWGYSGHSIEAIRFMCDTDMLLGGFGLFGGRGEYTGKIKLLDIGPEGGEQEGDGEVIAETEEIPYECGPRQKFPMLFDEPIPLQAQRWYVAWCRISGPSSDCGSSGQTMVTTEDQVMFYFKSSKKSNNGTDVNAGQIPQLLYRVVTTETVTPPRAPDAAEPIYILSKDFSRAVSKECFASLLALLQWSWNTFKAGAGSSADTAPALTDLQRLVYVSRASLRLLRAYTNETYPEHVRGGRAALESVALAESIGDVRALLKQILADGGHAHKRPNAGKVRSARTAHQTAYIQMMNGILDECHHTFVACFHAFYPTAYLKWSCLCELLGESSGHISEDEISAATLGNERLLSAVLSALCGPSVRLRSTFPLLGAAAEQRGLSPSDNTGLPMLAGGDHHHYPVLVEQMSYRSQIENGISSSTGSTWTWRDVLERLLALATAPVRISLSGQRTGLSPGPDLAQNCCLLLSRVVAELAHQCSANDDELQGACGRALQTTPSRFTRTNQSRTWNTGNGSPDAICFQVDRAGIAIAGLAVFAGLGHYEYELELLEDGSSVSTGEGHAHTQRWNNLETIRGSFGPEDYNPDIMEIKFDRPVPIKENVKYAFRLRNHGGRTSNGDGGLNTVKGPDNTLFTFSTCSLSFNGTTQTRGQIPHILYYSNPTDSETVSGSRALAELAARRATLAAVTSIVSRCSALLATARERAEDVPAAEILADSCVVNTLLPLVLAHVSPLVTSDPRSGVQVLTLIQDMLPHVAALNLLSGTGSNDTLELDTTSQHYTWVQSDHPYKLATVSNYRVAFAENVKWLSLEFDPMCGTAQPEDCLQLYVPSVPGLHFQDDDNDAIPTPYWPVLHKFSSCNSQWPQSAVILPGNEVIFSLETASDYLKDDRANTFGFRCLVVGYEWQGQGSGGGGLRHLEAELAFLGGMCAAGLMKRDLTLGDAAEGDAEIAELVAQQALAQHGNLLARGLALTTPPTVSQALDGHLPFSVHSNERLFLRDFVGCVAGSSGGRLAQWLQPASRVDPARCQVLYNRDELRCGWPAIVTILTRDQYGDLVHVTNLRVEVKAVPIDKSECDVGGGRKMRRLSQPDPLTFGGLPPPPLHVPYEPTIRDKMCFHSVTLLKPFQAYSFEELRYASPPIQRSSENMLVRPNSDGTYSATWTPASVGCYSVLVTIDGYAMEEAYKVEVREPPQGLTPPTQQLARRPPHQPSKLRKFVARNSAGLRIRTHPSLQSEQIGIVHVNGTIAFVDEIHNDDGVWLRLSTDTIKQYCSASSVEAWCLQYNQHLGKTLLLPVEEPRSILDQVITETILRKLPEIHDRRKTASGQAEGYQVIKCGASGHNVRARPSLKAPPVGMLVLGNHIGVTEYVVNSDGCWVLLDQPTRDKYCFNHDGEAWSLAMGHNNVLYLGTLNDVENDYTVELQPHLPNKRGFDFTTTTLSKDQETPFMFGVGSTSGGGAASSSGAESVSTNPFVFGDADRPDSPKVARKEKHKSIVLPKWLKAHDENKDSNMMKELPAELSGVCVKELVKALGESRANGNGITPPDTPRRSASPRSQRSSSPVAIPAMARVAVPQPSVATSLCVTSSGMTGRNTVNFVQDSASSSPQAYGSSRSIGVSPLVSGTGGAETSGRRGSTQSDTSALVSSLTRDLSQSPSQATGARDLTPSPSPSPSASASASPLEHSPRRLAQTGTQTSPESLRSHFSIGTSGIKDERVSPKLTRKERNLTGCKSRPKRAISPANIHSALPSTSKLSLSTSEPIKQAISPSVAESLRAVFAAFLWHEGIVHDAMACASFLKFHPTLPKKGALVVTRHAHHTEPAADKRRAELTKEERARQRHSVEVSTAGNYLHIQPATLETLTRSAANANANRNRTKKLPSAVIKEDIVSSDTSYHTITVLPPALKSLVYLWEELTTNCLQAITQQGPISSPNQTKIKKTICTKNQETKESRERNTTLEKESKKSSRKKKEWKPMSRALEDLALAGFLQSTESDTACELCGEAFPHPVTYHMRSAHPGCGAHAGGKGYNSSGNFCVGWAGNCGDGGVAGSSWYLVCDLCREKYMRAGRGTTQRHHGNRSRLSRKKPVFITPPVNTKSISATLSPATSISNVDAHLVMKNNAMFLLELASAAHPGLPPHQRRPSTVNMPAVAENQSPPDFSGPFGPPPPFQCLRTLGAVAQRDEPPFYEEVLRRQSFPGPGPGPSHAGQRPLSEVSLSDNETETTRGLRFHRSVSMGTNGVPWARTGQDGRIIMLRKRNNSSCETSSDTGSSLLCNPSATLQKLIPNVDNSAIVSQSTEVHHDSVSLLQRPVMAFVLQQHDLDALQLAMKQALRKAMCRVYAMQALNWLLRSVTQPVSLHDLLWWFVTSLTPTELDTESDDDNKPVRRTDEQEFNVCEHPLADISIAGDAVHPLPATFHALLQTIADLMVLLPMGSALQQMAVRCWGLRFTQADHTFLHRSQVFSNISKILSRSEELEDCSVSMHESHTSMASHITANVECLRDFSSSVEIKASSRQAMIGSLTDGSTETFWESGDEDRNKTKSLIITCAPHHQTKMICLHVDNCRDLANKVSSISFFSGPNADEFVKLRTVEVESRLLGGWVNCSIIEQQHTVIRLELKGPDNSLRVRQIRILGQVINESIRVGKLHNAITIQQRNCEAETLRVFRLITSQVFGKLILGDNVNQQLDSSATEPLEESNDLREHMVGILFSRSKLTHLQKQVIVHIVQAIRKETLRVREEWENILCSGGAGSSGSAGSVHSLELARATDTYCFEMLSMVLALSGSSVGRAYLSHQHLMLADLLSLLHTGSARVQRQVTALLRRMLPEISPEALAKVINVGHLPPADFSIVSTANKDTDSAEQFDVYKIGILDVFLSIIAKSLSVQVKIKSKDGNGYGGFKGISTVTLATSIHPRDYIGERWWMRGTVNRKLAEVIIHLLKDMAAGKLSEAWAHVTKGAVAENILNLTRLSDEQRSPNVCLHTATLWLALASLCVLDREHVEQLSSGQWASAGDTPRPTCSNHDDGETSAIIQCNVCGTLCADCDRFLHLHRRTRMHQRQVCKEEEEAIKVELHEGCGRTKLFWLLALADARTLKALVEFREGGPRTAAAAATSGTCRFCGVTGSSGLLAIGNVCADHECQEYARTACNKVHTCGHMCGGVTGEPTCLPCLHGCLPDATLRQDADDMCMICFTEALAAAPAVQLQCGHVFHLHCCRAVLLKRWAGPRITFSFSLCPICKADIEHSALTELLAPIHDLLADVRRKALMRLEYEGLHSSDAVTTPGSRWHADPAGYAMDRYAYYVCYKCGKAYYGGEARCDAELAERYDPTELVCGACSDVARAQMCPKHGTDFLEYKCRYCCSVAVFFCFGTTHFCNPCHDDFQRVTNLPRAELPSCPAGPKAKQLDGDECPLHVKHPPTGEEFALGCGVCRNAHTF